MKTERTLSEKRRWLYNFIYNNSIEKKRAKRIYEMLLRQDKQFIKEVLEEINNKIEKKIKVEKKSNNYTKDDVFAYGYVRGLEDMNKLFKRIIKQKAGEELLK